ISKFMNETKKYVASHQNFDPGWQNVTVLYGEDVVAQVKKLQEGPGGTIGIFGSNKLLVDLMNAGLVDEYQLIVSPVALGDGTPVFKGLKNSQHFVLTEHKKLKSGQMFM